MPVPARDRLAAMTRDLGSQAEVARTLGVSRSRISRWLKDEEPDLVNLRKLEGVEFIIARLLQTFEPSTARK
ncbi:MAG: helix-turn-helix transcriptional regulator, partial [Actinobacteria bacterium]|nr:helix-turn-helix transcriptional regulator [Actinomycetota bacterium]